jgi:hypothetical protein
MDIFNDLKNKNYNYSDKIESNKYTQSINSIIKNKPIDFDNLNIKETDNDIVKNTIKQLYIKETDNNIIKSVINESINHFIDNECVKYTKKEMSEKYKSIYELILSIKDNEYQILEMKEKDKYVSDEKILLCSEADDKYNTYNFNKKISKSLICSNLQKYKDNLLSLILFYNDYFKINLIICHDNKYYKSGLKNFENIYIKYIKNGWIIQEMNSENIKYENILDLKYCIELDIKTNFIYNLYLKAISNYKVDELISIANELNIDLNKNGKKKIKKELYDEINLFKL